MHNKNFCCDHDVRIGVAVFNGKLMKNWLRLFCSLLVLGLAQGVSALGLGSITAESALNEPLEAQIELLNIGALSEQEIIVQIGSTNDYQMAGVAREYFHTGIEFEPVLAGPNGRSYIRLRTTAPVREPYLNFVIQVRWPQGRLLREYTLLLDLPVFSGRTEANQITQPSTANPAVATPAPRAVPRTAQASQPSQPAPVPPQQAFGGPTAAGSDYRVKTGDTLWSLAGRVANGQQMTRYQAMLAIRDLNPQAFVNGDPNSLQAGYLVRIPTEGQANTRTSGQAYNEFVSLQQGGGSVASSATPISAAATDFRNQPSAPVSTGGHLALSSSSSLGSGAGSAGDVEVIESLSSENETLKEELDRSEIENDDLRERVAMLEERLALSESLIEIENEGLANVQESLAQAEEVQVEASVVETESAPVPAPVPVVSEEPPEPGLLAKIMTYAPFLGALIVIALLVIMFMMKRRKASAEDDFLRDDLEGESPLDAPIDDDLDTDHQVDEPFEATSTMSAEEAEEDDGDTFESMDELFGSDEDEDEFTEEAEPDQEDTPEPEEADPSGVEPEPDHSDDVEDIDLEAALEDLDDFADMDSFGDDEVEDFDLESEDSFEDSVDENSVDDASEIEASDDEGQDADSDEIELPDSGEEDSPEEDDGNSMDFDLDDFDAVGEDEGADSEDEEPAGNEMEFDSSEIELPEDDEADDDELDMGNATEFDSSEIELPEAEDDEESEEHAGNEMEFDLDEVDLPDTDDAEEEDASEDIDNLVDLDVGDIELPEDVDSSDESVDDEDEAGLSFPGDEVELPDVDEDTTEDMDDLLAGLDDEVADVPDDETDSDSEEDIDLDLGADLDLDDDLLEGLGDDDDEHADLSEEMTTKLELADAYIEMGDVSGAKQLIDEIMSGGNDEQKAEAAKLAERIEGLA